ncbi:MAG TPA: ethanolamine ammonia-lyase subunit EutC [Acidobacteriaceae bacterium]|nr:ethanolamine ammonia-lyase subunit EutC [Acidobacteriaceae bacterium]
MAGITRTPKNPDAWARLRRWTPARIGLGRAGSSLPTQPMLDFELAHARARDAVHAAFDADALARALRDAGFGDAILVSSQARDRMEYLLRPDLGRSLDSDSRERLHAASPGAFAVVIGDGLSALAPARHAVPLLVELRRQLDLWPNVTIVVANLARVALGDEIGEILRADAVVVLIGERPGLSSPDSLGLYFTWAPRVGRTDAERNCISNVRPQGLPYAEAAARLTYLLREARRLKISGVELKDDSESSQGALP